MFRIASQPAEALPRLQPRAAAWNPALDDALVSDGPAHELVARLHQPGALVITTGQQPGLFTGPVYTVHKALAAAATAREWSRRWNRPVVPLLWIAGDDHDFAEAGEASWFDAHGALVDWRLPPRPASAPQRPMSAEVLPGAIIDGLAVLQQTLPSGVARDATLNWLRRHYRPGATLHQACAAALAELLAPHGVLCFDPTRVAFKRAQVPLLHRALHEAAALDAALANLPDPGTGIASGAGASLVFVTTAAGRERLMCDGAGFRTRRSGERFTLTQLDHLLDSAPERFSANVLLRPVVESALLPTAAYVAGPAEFRYLTRQAFAVYPLLDVPVQTPIPRWSGTVITATSDRLAERLQIAVDAVIGGDPALEREIIARDFPADARHAIDVLREQLAQQTRVIADAAERIDPVLDRAIHGRSQRVGQLIDAIEQVITRHLRRRDTIQFAQLQRLTQALRPRGEPQERVVTAASFLGRYGTSWLDAVDAAVTGWATHFPDRDRS